MAKSNFTSVWVPYGSISQATLRGLHQRVFPGNVLSVSDGYVKVAVPAGTALPAGASQTVPTPALTANGRVA